MLRRSSNAPGPATPPGIIMSPPARGHRRIATFAATLGLGALAIAGLAVPTFGDPSEPGGAGASPAPAASQPAVAASVQAQGGTVPDVAGNHVGDKFSKDGYEYEVTKPYTIGAGNMAEDEGHLTLLGPDGPAQATTRITTYLTGLQNNARFYVTSIADRAFEGQRTLKHLTIDTATVAAPLSIGVAAFAGTELEGNLTIGSGIVGIGDRAFEDTWLTSIALEGPGWGNTITVGDSVFATTAAINPGEAGPKVVYLRGAEIHLSPGTFAGAAGMTALVLKSQSAVPVGAAEAFAKVKCRIYYHSDASAIVKPVLPDGANATAYTNATAQILAFSLPDAEHQAVDEADHAIFLGPKTDPTELTSIIPYVATLPCRNISPGPDAPLNLGDLKANPVIYTLTPYDKQTPAVTYRVTYPEPPSFTRQPLDTVTDPGGDATFTVALADTLPKVSVAWQTRPAGTAAWADLKDQGAYSGTATPILTVKADDTALNGREYRAVASNYLDTVGSDPAALILTSDPAAPVPAPAPETPTTPTTPAAPDTVAPAPPVQPAEEVPVTVQFVAGKGKLDPAQATRTVAPGAAIGTLPVPTRAKHVFLGWATAPTGGALLTPATPIVAATQAYAMWAKKGKLAKWKGAKAIKLRAKAKAKSKTVATVKKGKKLRVVARKGDWVKVRTVTGTTGWAKLTDAVNLG
ncbi:MAG: SH3 domain-containing protein [Bifidobacteriaceae bacterium]|jgi:hypothetical protein|nr:SH3 domain-containing protein [Bifidobacteriaceae bacterium]